MFVIGINYKKYFLKYVIILFYIINYLMFFIIKVNNDNVGIKEGFII